MSLVLPRQLLPHWLQLHACCSARALQVMCETYTDLQLYTLHDGGWHMPSSAFAAPGHAAGERPSSSPALLHPPCLCTSIAHSKSCSNTMARKPASSLTSVSIGMQVYILNSIMSTTGAHWTAQTCTTLARSHVFDSG